MAFIVAVFLSAGIGLKDFKLDASSDALVIEGDEAFEVYRETGEKFGNSDFLIITFTPKLDLFSPQSLATIKTLDMQLENLPGVQSVLTILDAPIFFQPKVPLAEGIYTLKVALAASSGGPFSGYATSDSLAQSGTTSIYAKFQATISDPIGSGGSSARTITLANDSGANTTFTINVSAAEE